MDADMLSCLCLIAQGAEQVETQAPFPRKSTGKHKTSPDCSVCPNCFTLSSGGKKKKKSCLHLIFAGASETKPHLQEALMALRALTALPRHSALRWHIPGSSPLPASTSLRTAAGTTAKEELSLQTAFTKQSLLHCSQL